MSGNQKNWSVLVVDDEPLTQDLLRLMLEPAGFHVSGADDGAMRFVKEGGSSKIYNSDFISPR